MGFKISIARVDLFLQKMKEQNGFVISEEASFLTSPVILTPPTLKTLDVHNDTERESFFKEIALKAYSLASSYFTEKTGKSFQPSSNYQGQRVRTEEELEVIKSRLNHEEEKKLAAEDAKRQRFMAKFSKEAEKKAKVKKQEEKRKELKNLQDLKNTKDPKLRASKLQSLISKNKVEKESDGDDDDGSDFDLEIDQEAGKSLPKKDWNKKGNKKRDFKDSKFGFGGKKRGLKRNTEESLNDASSYSLQKNKRLFPGMKGGKVKKSHSNKKNNQNRPGKARRQQMRNKKASYNQKRK
jgi:rRNA-processing protein EBP2